MHYEKETEKKVRKDLLKSNTSNLNNKSTTPRGRTSKRFEAKITEFGPGIAESIADAAQASLDDQVQKLRGEGKLDAGKSTLVMLKWTPEAFNAGQEVKKVYLP